MDLKQIKQEAREELYDKVMTYTVKYGVLRAKYPESEAEMDALESEMREHIKSRLEETLDRLFDEIEKAVDRGDDPDNLFSWRDYRRAMLESLTRFKGEVTR